MFLLRRKVELCDGGGRQRASPTTRYILTFCNFEGAHMRAPRAPQRDGPHARHNVMGGMAGTL
jgi:hypothetical protein